MAGADSASVIPLFFLCRCSSFFERDKTNRHVTECTEELCIYNCIENASICFSSFCPFDFPSFLYWSNLSRAPILILLNNTFRLSNFIPRLLRINFYKRMKILFLLSCLLFFSAILFQSIISKCFYFISK